MSQQDLQQRLKDLIDGALEKFLIQDYDNAIRNLKAAEVLDRHNPEIMYNLGVNYARLGLHKTARTYFDKLINLPSGFVDILEVKKICAYVCIRMKDLDRAEELLDEVIEHTPGDITAHSMKGYCLELRGNLTEALIAYRAILTLDKGNSNAHNSLAYILATSGKNLDEALKHSRLAFEADSGNAAYCDTLGYVYLKRNDRANAKKFLQRAHDLNPRSAEIKEHLAKVKN